MKKKIKKDEELDELPTQLIAEAPSISFSYRTTDGMKVNEFEVGVVGKDLEEVYEYILKMKRLFHVDKEEI